MLQQYHMNLHFAETAIDYKDLAKKSHLDGDSPPNLILENQHSGPGCFTSRSNAKALFAPL